MIARLTDLFPCPLYAKELLREVATGDLIKGEGAGDLEVRPGRKEELAVDKVGGRIIDSGWDEREGVL